jgi:hypothetical protein
MGFFTDIGKTLTRTGILIIAGEFVRKQLNKLIKRQIIINAIKLCFFLGAVLISSFSFFGVTVSLYISSIIITGLLIHSAIMVIPKVTAIVPTLWKLLISMINKKAYTPSEILAEYIRLCHPWALKPKAWLDVKLKGWVPTANDLAAYVWGYLGKRFLGFVISFAVFLITFNLVVRPLLHAEIIGIGAIKIYLVPFFMAIDFIFKTHLMEILI